MTDNFRKLAREDFPGNSRNSSNRVIEGEVDNTPEREKRTPIVTGKTVRQERGFLQKFMENFFGDDISGSIKDYIFYDIVIPALKSTIDEAVSGGISMFLYGEGRHRRNSSKSGGQKPYISYGSAYRSGGRDEPTYAKPRITDRHDFDEVLFENRYEADAVLNNMQHHLEKYKSVSVADFYEWSGVDSQWTDFQYGWTSLRNSYTERVRGGYIVRLPRPVPID